MAAVGTSEHTRLLALLRERALLRGDFVLSSGQRSPYYLDARLVTLSAAGSPLIGAILLYALDGQEVDAVAGLSLGADPIVSAVTVMAGLGGRSIDGLLVRKERKEHGTAKRIEGPMREGLRVAIVDDTLTTGASSLQAAAAVEAEGGCVVGIYALIDREQGARRAIEGAGYPFHPIFTADEIVQSGRFP